MSSSIRFFNNINMKRTIITIITLGLLGALSAADSDQLWKASWKSMETNGLWLPGVVNVYEEIIDQQGNLQSSGSNSYRIIPDKDLEHLEIVELHASGNHTERQNQTNLNLLHSMGLGVPYFVSFDTVKVNRKEHTQKIASIECTGYDFQTTSEGKRFTGTVWIDPTSADPLLIEMRLSDETPVKFEGMDIDHYYRTIELKRIDGIITADNLVVEAWVSARSLFKRNLVVHKITVQMSEPWRAK